jgi:hypothetical protein
VKILTIIETLSLLLVAVSPARALDSLSLESLATCQESWFEWKANDPARLQGMADSFKADFSYKELGAFVPKSNLTIAGLPVTRVFPESIGMAVGFSVVVNASFDETKKRLEQKIGKSIKQCKPSDGMRACALEIGEKKSLLLMAGEEPEKNQETLFGCFYFYEK